MLYPSYLSNNLKSNNFSYYNPFNQTKHTWLVEINLFFAHIEKFAAIFEEFATSISYFELDANGNFDSKPEDIWCLQLYFNYLPSENFIHTQLQFIAAQYKIDIPEFTITTIQDIDWIKHTQENFPPFSVGRFFIHSSNFKGPYPHSLYNLQIDAGRAFGTGEHETTSSCLLAISTLAKKRKFYNMLDMGCGSGILAIAQAKIWKQFVHAVDVDAQSVITAKCNIELNKVHKLVNVNYSNGYKSKYILDNSPYDLIISNILAKPLVKFSPYLVRHLKPKGITILSGLLAKQEKMVINAHRLQGLHLIQRIKKNLWVTLVMEKSL